MKNASLREHFLFKDPTDIFVNMGVQRLLIKEFLQRSGGHLILDVRSPGEYVHAHIPGAHNLPLFTDEERKKVGTTYKQQSREQAIKTGLDMFGPKMRKMVEEVENLSSIYRTNGESSDQQSSGSSPVFVHCWRGGMRSGAVAWLLDLYGFKVFTLAGGYKAFRNHVLDIFRQPYSFRILGGYTGSGKTEVLQEMRHKGERVVDLEQIASHKGSAFGSFKMPPQPTQEMFENLLAMELEKQGASGIENELPAIWLEDESQRIGNLNIPSALWAQMRQSPVFFLEIPFEERLEHIAEEYGVCDPEKLIDSVRRISQRLGGLETKNAINWLQEGNFREAFRILLHYYDKLYIKGLHNREALNALLTTMPCARVTPHNAQVLTKHQPV